MNFTAVHLDAYYAKALHWIADFGFIEFVYSMYCCLSLSVEVICPSNTKFIDQDTAGRVKP